MSRLFSIMLWNAIHGVWTWFHMFKVSLLRDWWYFALKCALNYFYLLELFAMICCLVYIIWPNWVTPGQPVMPNEVYCSW